MSAPERTERRIRVLVVDDHEMVRSGLAAFLGVAPDLELVGEAGSGEEALALCERVQPDVVLMDMVLPGMDGVSATQAIRDRWPQVRVVALTSFAEEDLVRRALQAGALSYLLKTVGATDLVAAIRDAARGRSTLAPEATEALIRQVTRPRPLGHDLSPREREVLRLMRRGLSNRAIADELVISPSTVDFHVSNILSKLGASSRTEAVALAVQHNLAP